jgi:hypothetical protein
MFDFNAKLKFPAPERRNAIRLLFFGSRVQEQKRRRCLPGGPGTCPQHWLLCHLGLYESEFEFPSVLVFFLFIWRSSFFRTKVKQPDLACRRLLDPESENPRYLRASFNFSWNLTTRKRAE